LAIKIRLKRIGRRNRPFYRVVVMDSRKRRDGAAIEELGWYNPIARDKDSNFVLKEDRVFHWLTVGAQPTDAVNGLMKRAGLALKWHLIKQGLDEDSIRKEMEKWELNKENRKKPAKVEKPAEVVDTAPAEAEEPETAVEEEKTESTPPEENLPDQEEAPTEPSTDKPEETEVSATDGDNTSESSESESKPSNDDTPETEESTDEKQTEEGGDQAEEK